MSINRSPTIFTLGKPTVECKAGNCLFTFVISTTSPSTIVIFPTPALAMNSAANDPTPPIPTTKTLEFFSLFKPSFLNNNSALSVHSAIFYSILKFENTFEIRFNRTFEINFLY